MSGQRQPKELVRISAIDGVASERAVASAVDGGGDSSDEDERGAGGANAAALAAAIGAIGSTGAVYRLCPCTHPCHFRASLTHRRQQLRMASGARPRRGLSSPRPVAPAPVAADPPVCARVLWARLIALGGVFGMLPQAGHGAKAARRPSGHKAGGPPPQQPEAGTGKCELSSATLRAPAACGGMKARSSARMRRPPMRFRAREAQPQGPGAGEGKQRASSPGFDIDGAEREPAVEPHLAEGARGERNQTNASAALHFGRTTPICSHDSRRSVSKSVSVAPTVFEQHVQQVTIHCLQLLFVPCFGQLVLCVKKLSPCVLGFLF